MIRETRRAVRVLIERFRGSAGRATGESSEVTPIPDEVKRQIDAEGDEVRRELVRLQGRMLSLAEEYRQGDIRA